MSKIKNGDGLDQNGTGTFKQQQFETAGVEEGVKGLIGNCCTKHTCGCRSVHNDQAYTYSHKEQKQEIQETQNAYSSN